MSYRVNYTKPNQIKIKDIFMQHLPCNKTIEGAFQKENDPVKKNENKNKEDDIQ